MRTHWITRLIVGTVVPPVAAAFVLAIGFHTGHSPSVAEAVWTQFILYFGFLFLGFYMAALQCLAYSTVMEVIGSRLPVISRNVTLYMCFSAAVLSVCTYVPFYHGTAIELFDGIILSVSAFAGAATGLALWLLRRQKGDTPSFFEIQQTVGSSAPTDQMTSPAGQTILGSDSEEV